MSEKSNSVAVSTSADYLIGYERILDYFKEAQKECPKGPGLFRGNHGGIAPTENQGFVGAMPRGPAQPIDERIGVSDIGALHEGLPLQENETALRGFGEGWGGVKNLRLLQGVLYLR